MIPRALLGAASKTRDEEASCGTQLTAVSSVRSLAGLHLTCLVPARPAATTACWADSSCRLLPDYLSASVSRLPVLPRTPTSHLINPHFSTTSHGHWKTSFRRVHLGPAATVDSGSAAGWGWTPMPTNQILRTRIALRHARHCLRHKPPCRDWLSWTCRVLLWAPGYRSHQVPPCHSGIPGTTQFCS